MSPSDFELIFYLCLSFFLIDLIIGCLCEAQSSFIPKECKILDKNNSRSSVHAHNAKKKVS